MLELVDTRCPVCGEEKCAPHLSAPPGRFVVDAPPELTSEYRSTEQVFRPDHQGVLRLVYAVGDPIPEEEARRQGLEKVVEEVERGDPDAASGADKPDKSAKTARPRGVAKAK